MINKSEITEELNYLGITLTVDQDYLLDQLISEINASRSPTYNEGELIAMVVGACG